MFLRLAAIALLLASSLPAADPPRVIVLVIDGLRPDVIRPDIMPNLARLKQQGTWCANAHSIFPTVTRVNSASIATGSLPAVHGIVSNSMYVAEVSPKPFDTSNYRNLTRLAEVSGGRTLPVPTLGELLEARGVRFIAISSGSSGSAFLLNPTAPNGTGVLINVELEEARRAAYPDSVNAEIQRRFGIEKLEGIPELLWTERVLRDYVIADRKPHVIIDWMTEPDGAQHRAGVGSPDGLAALKADDEQIGLLLDKLKQAGLDQSTNIIVTADHGFAAQPDSMNLNAVLKSAGHADDVIVASNGASVLLYVKNHDASAIRRIVAELQKTDGVDAIFTSAVPRIGGVLKCREGELRGAYAGTFALEAIGQCHPTRGADIIVTFQWSDEKNEFGFPGRNLVAANEARRGVPGRSGHGGLSSWQVHTPMILIGPAFKTGAVVETPVSNADIAPTILSLQGIAAPPSMTGRVIREAFAKSGASRQPRVRTTRTAAGSFCSTLQISEIGKHRYVDLARRCRD